MTDVFLDGSSGPLALEALADLVETLSDDGSGGGVWHGAAAPLADISDELAEELEYAADWVAAAALCASGDMVGFDDENLAGASTIVVELFDDRTVDELLVDVRLAAGGDTGAAWRLQTPLHSAVSQLQELHGIVIDVAQSWAIVAELVGNDALVGVACNDESCGASHTPAGSAARLLRRGALARHALDVAGDALASIRDKLGSPGRNDDCPCGAGRKFKHCCGR